MSSTFNDLPSLVSRPTNHSIGDLTFLELHDNFANTQMDVALSKPMDEEPASQSPIEAGEGPIFQNPIEEGVESAFQEGFSSQITQSAKFPEMEQIVTKFLTSQGFYITSERKSQRGGNNSVQFYKNEEKGETRVLRVSLREKKETKTTRRSTNIWYKASSAGLSPNVYFAGLVQSAGLVPSISGLRFVVIMAAFPFSVAQYLKAHELTIMNRQTLSMNLYILMNNIAKKLNLDCTDIKPQNIVIDPKNLTVLMIDVDGDFCSAIEGMDPGLNTWLGVLVLAHHLFHKFDDNFLAPFLSMNFEELMVRYPELKVLYCSGTAIYRSNVRHYTRKKDPNQTSDSDEYHNEPCEDGEFDTFFTESLHERKASMYSSNIKVGGKLKRRIAESEQVSESEIFTDHNPMPPAKRRKIIRESPTSRLVYFL